MKRSEINAAIRMAMDVLEKNCFYLPPFAHWTPEQLRQSGAESERIIKNGLGWDISDFGTGDFDRVGGVLFTLRNGNHMEPEQGTPYTEKIIIVKPNQEIPLHFHWSKTEDIINRGGGVMMIQLYNSLDNGEIDRSSPVVVFCDGCRKQVEPGEIMEFQPGESITLTPLLFHRFWASESAGTVICGEVSTVNDDLTDNAFADPTSRFADIEEDEPPLRLLCNEYSAIGRD